MNTGWLPVINQKSLSSRLNTGWAQALNTRYPTVTSQVVNRQGTVLPTGQNQTADPRSLTSGFYDIATSTDTGSIMGGGTVIGGSNITYGSSGISTGFLIILAGLLLLFIWR